MSHCRTPINLHRGPRRHGATIVLMLLLLVVIVGMVAFSVEVGRMFLLRCQMQTAVDAGALAANLKLQQDPQALEEAAAAARDFIQQNHVGRGVTVPTHAIDVEIGQWNDDTGTFVVTSVSPNAVRVSARQDDEPFFFGRIFGRTSYGAPASATASGSGRPLDIVMVLDMSGSMGSSGRIQALRNAAPAFVDVIEEYGGSDQIAVIGYGVDPDDFNPGQHGNGAPYTNVPAHLYPPTSSYRVGVLEGALTDDFDSLRNNVLTTSNLVSNKYGGGTPIGAGIRDGAHYLRNAPAARTEVNNVPVEKVMVMMSDGYANKPSGNGSGYALAMADYAASLGVTVYTISLGNSADVNLMEQIAARTGGRHFDARGSGEQALTQLLTHAFRQAAGAIKRAQLVQ